jgi:hypothetical protein
MTFNRKVYRNYPEKKPESDSGFSEKLKKNYWAAKYAARLAMSSSLSAATIGAIIGSLRIPSLKALICLARYCSFCPARFGHKGFTLFPVAPWQLAQIADLTFPAATSPAMADDDAKRRAVSSAKKSDFIEVYSVSISGLVKV